MAQRARADIKNRQPQELVGDNILADILGFLGMGQAPDASDLMSPIGGMARMGKSGQKFIDLFVGKEGRVFDIDPLGNRSGTHSKFIKDKFNQTMEKFLREGGVRGSEAGLEFAVDKTGKPLIGKQTMDRSLQTMLRAYTEKGFSVDEPIRIDKLLPDGSYKSVEIPLIQALRNRF